MVAGKYRNTRLATQTLILIGAEDPIVRPGMMGNHEDNADDLVVEVVDGASHFMVDEKPELVVDRALEFFARS